MERRDDHCNDCNVSENESIHSNSDDDENSPPPSPQKEESKCLEAPPAPAKAAGDVKKKREKVTTRLADLIARRADIDANINTLIQPAPIPRRLEATSAGKGKGGKISSEESTTTAADGDVNDVKPTELVLCPYEVEVDDDRRRSLEHFKETHRILFDGKLQMAKLGKEVDLNRGIVREAQRAIKAAFELRQDFEGRMVDARKSIEKSGVGKGIADQWMGMYFQLADYRASNGDCNVRAHNKDKDTRLGHWVVHQRQNYGKNRHITQDQIDLLTELDFVWEPRKQQFLDGVTMLRKFVDEHGYPNVPKNDPEHKALLGFVETQQEMYRERLKGRPNRMTDERLQMLEEAGIKWRDFGRRKSDQRYQDWDGALLQLKEFIDKYGHTNPGLLRRKAPRGGTLKKELFRLERFCVWARQEYALYKEGKPCQLGEERFEQLRDIGLWLEKPNGRLGLAEDKNEILGLSAKNEQNVLNATAPPSDEALEVKEEVMGDAATVVAGVDEEGISVSKLLKRKKR